MRQRFAILTVCTANICRSPLAELLLAERLDLRRFEVASAGVRGWEDHPMDGAVKAEARRLDLDPDRFRSRPITPGLVETSNLVLTATREHRAQVLEIAPAALRRTFTLRELAQILPTVSEADLPSTVRAAGTRRGTASTDVDVPDPYRGDALRHREVAEMIDDATRTVAAELQGLWVP